MEKIESEFASKLELKNIFVNETSFTRSEVVPSNIGMNVKFDHEIVDIDTTSFKVILSGVVSNKDDSIRATVTVIALFELQVNVVENDFIEQVKVNNTLAIMFPYLRAQFILVSSQSGVNLTLPAMNINAYFENKKKNK